MKNKSLIIGGIVLSLVIVLSIGTYAYWTITKSQDGSNDIIAACLDINMESVDGTFGLNPAWPISDAEGMQLEGYTFTVTNNCEEDVNYIIGMDSLEVSGVSYLSYDSIKLSIDNNSPVIYGEQEEIGHIEENDAYTIRDSKKINTAVVKNGVPNTHNVKVWIKSDAPVEEQSKTFSGRMFITGGQNIENDKPLAKLLATGDISKTEECSTNTDGSGENYGVTTCVPVTGNNVKYMLYKDELIISGTGDSKDYSDTGLAHQIILNVIETNNFTEEEKTFIKTNEMASVYFGFLLGLTFEDFATFFEVMIGQRLTSYSELGSLLGFSETDTVMFTSLATKLEELGVIGTPKDLIIRDGVTSIGTRMMLFSSFNNIYLADNITRIYDHAFEQVFVLNSIELSNNLTSIGYHAFYDIQAPNADMVLPNSLIDIAEYGLSGMALNSLKLPANSLTYVPYGGDFNYLYVPTNITRLGGVINKSETIIYLYGSERTLKNSDGYGNHDLTQYKEVVWNYTD